MSKSGTHAGKQAAREYLAAVVSGDHLEHALKTLTFSEQAIPEDVREEAILLSGKYQHWVEMKHNDTHSFTEVRQERNRIRDALLHLVTELPENLEIDTPRLRILQKQNLYILFAIAYLLIAGAISFFLFSPKTPVRIEADLLVDQMSYGQYDNNYKIAGQALTGITLYHFEHLYINADQVLLDEEGDSSWTPVRLSQGKRIQLSPFPESIGVGIQIEGECQINELKLSPNARFKIARGERLGDMLSAYIFVEQKESVWGSIQYASDLKLYPEQVKIKGLEGYEDFFTVADMHIQGKADSERNLRFQSYPGIFSMLLTQKDSLHLEATRLRMSDLKFFRKDDNLTVDDPIPTVLGGEIRIKEANESPMQVIGLREREELNLIGEQVLNITQLKIQAEGIRLSMEGEIGKIETGQSRDVRNPSWLKWLLHNHMYKLIVGLVVLVGLLGILPAYLTKKLIGPADRILKIVQLAT